MDAPAPQGRHPLPSPSGRRCHAVGVTDEGAKRRPPFGQDRIRSRQRRDRRKRLQPSSVGLSRHLLPEGEGARASARRQRQRRLRLSGMNAPLRVSALPTLRVLTCGSVDDGKWTLIGRLLYEKKLIFDDQLSALKKDSKKFGTTEDAIDFALLVDGLEAEREQGITIDVAYRYFATEARSFIVADTPGHEQYTRNMATGASNADVAIVLGTRAKDC